MTKLLPACAVAFVLAGAFGCAGAGGGGGCGAAPAEEPAGTTVTDDGRTRTTRTDHGRRGTVIEQTNSTNRPAP